MKPKSSFIDKNNMLFVDCAECKSGGNSTAENKCSAGGSLKRIRQGGCFSGKLLDKYENP